MRRGCRIVSFLLLMFTMSASMVAQNNYWTSKVKSGRVKTEQPKSYVQEKRAVTVNRPPDTMRIERVQQKNAVILPVPKTQELKPLSVAEPPSVVHAPQAYSGFSKDSLFIQFQQDSVHIDMDLSRNRESWNNFELNFRRHFANVPPNSLRLDIYSGASPEGTAAHNRWLGENRGIAIRRMVRQRLGNSVGAIIVHNEAARWEGLYESLAGSSEPWRDEALRIIEQSASTDEHQRDQREMQLRALRDGTVWPVLREKYLSPLRSGASDILSYVGGRDTIVVRDTIIMECTGTSLFPMTEMSGVAAWPDNSQTVLRKSVQREPVWILRTNIPLLATATPNLQAELSIDHKDRWSINVEGVFSWWTFAYNAYANEMIYGSVELRRWLGHRDRHHTLDGWHIGLGVGGGYGDLECRSKGYQAEVFSVFVNIGWQHRFGRRKQWAFDAGIGLGYAYIPWRRYDGSTLFPVGKEEKHDDHLMWQETSRTNWFGATHVNISIGYVFKQKNGAWRRQKSLGREAEHYDYLHFRDSLMLRERFERDSAKVVRRLTPELIESVAHGDGKAERLKMRLDAKLMRLEDDLQHEMKKTKIKYKQ